MQTAIETVEDARLMGETDGARHAAARLRDGIADDDESLGVAASESATFARVYHVGVYVEAFRAAAKRFTDE